MALIYRIILLCTFLTPAIQSQSQQLCIGLNYYAGTGLSADIGLDISYIKKLNKDAILIGGEIRSIDWGNHIGINIGYGREYFNKDVFKVGGVSTFHPGLALFHNSSLGSFGLSHLFYLRWQSKKRSYLELDMGARYNFNPAYQEYGNNKQLEFPINLKWGLILGKSIKVK